MLDMKILRAVALAAALAAGQVAAAPADDLRKAVEFDDGNTVQKLVARGVDPNLKDRKGDPLLVQALREKSLKAARALIHAQNIDFDQPNAAGETALMMASLQGELDMVKLMVDDKEVEINKTGWTPLHYAATNGHIEIVKFLLDRSAYVDAESPNGTTPLMMAARGGHVDIVRLLLEEGADMRIRNQQGMTVIDFAEQYNQPEIAAGLKSRWQKTYQQSPPAPRTPKPAQSGKD
jgi:ankyrin repeat protein